MRYQRRGVDEEANVANFVESESVMRVEREGFVNVFSYVQVRGSSECCSLSLVEEIGIELMDGHCAVPLFWTQSGYSLKPAPLLSPERTHDQNLDALKRHFERTVPKYGPHVRSLFPSAFKFSEMHSFCFIFISPLSIWRSSMGKRRVLPTRIEIM